MLLQQEHKICWVSPRDKRNFLDVKNFDETSFSERFRLQSGGEGDVDRVKHKTYGFVCIKVHFDSKSADKEANLLLKSICHPNVVKFLGFYYQIGVKKGFVLEYMPGGSVSEAIHKKGVSKKPLNYSWIQQAGRGLQFLHESSIVHRDVKPSNMLLSEDMKILKLSDFGLTKHLNRATTSGKGGTGEYMAPEVVRANNWSPASDIYSFGMSIWEILHRKKPFADSSYDITARILNGELPAIKKNSRFAELIEKTKGQSHDFMIQPAREINLSFL